MRGVALLITMAMALTAASLQLTTSPSLRARPARAAAAAHRFAPKPKGEAPLRHSCLLFAAAVSILQVAPHLLAELFNAAAAAVAPEPGLPSAKGECQGAGGGGVAAGCMPGLHARSPPSPSFNISCTQIGRRSIVSAPACTTGHTPAATAATAPSQKQ